MHTYANRKHDDVCLDFCVSYQGLLCFFQPVIIHSLDTRLFVVLLKCTTELSLPAAYFWFEPKKKNEKYEMKDERLH